MDVTNIIAANAKQIREEKSLTLDKAAAVTGVSRSMLAQIEKGEVNPTISVLWKIANGYKVSFTSLLENKREAVSVIRQRDIKVLTEDEGRYLNYPVFPFNEKTLFETYRIILKKDGMLAAQPHLRGTEEYITVFAGLLEIIVGEESYLLAEGDSIHFCADVPHIYRNKGSAPVELSMLIYYNP